MIKTLAVAVMCLSLAGCLGTTTIITGSLCTAGPIVLDANATIRLTRPEKQQIATLNQSGEEICGWQAP
jgi:hypothetical protein